MKTRIPLMIALLVLVNVSHANPGDFINAYYREFEVASPPGSQQQLEFLLLEAENHVNANSDDAEAWLAVGLIRAGYAKSIGGMKGLAELKNARRELEQSIQIDPTAMSGAASGMLGRLYATVPRWPLAFGSKRRARTLLTEAMTEDPSGALPGLYYALLLAEEGETDDARDILESLPDIEMPCTCQDWKHSLRSQALTVGGTLPNFITE